jgi:hypothetical protein
MLRSKIILETKPPGSLKKTLLNEFFITAWRLNAASLKAA